MKTTYDASRGIDLYADSSGDDDWQAEKKRFYLHGFMVCGASDEWIRWMRAHETQFGGMVHWSDGRFGKAKQRLPNTKATCRELIATHPWLQTCIYVFDKQAYAESVSEKLGSAVKKSDIVKGIWEILAATYLKMLIPRLKEVVLQDSWGSTNIRNIVVNNPKGGDRGLITKVIMKEFGRRPQFVPTGHYGIDALDGVLWAFQRYFNLGKADCLPDSADDFGKNLRVYVLGVRSDRPTLLRNVSDIESFKEQP